MSKDRRSEFAEQNRDIPKQPRQLWMFNHYAIGPDMPGGNRHYELARELLYHGWDTTIFATPFSHKSAKMIRDVSFFHPFHSESVDGVDFRWIYSSPYEKNDWRRYLNMFTFAAASLAGSRGQGRPEVVIGSSPHLLAALAAYVLARRHGVPFIFEVRDLWPDSLIDMGMKNPVLLKPLAAIEKFLYKKANLITVLTEGIGTGVKNKGVDGDRILFLPNASKRPEPIDSDAREATRRQLGWQNKVVAIYAGAHGPANDLGAVVESAKQLPSDSKLKLVFLGDGPTKTDLVNQASGLCNVEFLDSVPKTDVGNVLRAADIGILSLKQTKVFEGARPNKLFDYMASGLPILTTIGGEAENVLKEANAGRHVPQDGLAAALIDFEHDGARRKRLGQSGFNYVSNTLTREQTAHMLAERLDQLTHERGV